MKVTFTVELDDAKALALAQFCKRVYFSTAREFATSNDEAYLTMASLEKIRDALAEQGVAPR